MTASNGYSDSFGDYATASPVPSEMSPPSEKYSAPFVYSAVPVPTPPETPLPSDEYSAPLPSNIGLSDLPTESKGQPDIAYSSCSPDTGDYLKCYDFESQPESSYSAIDESTDNGSMGYNDYGNDYVEPSNADGTINSSGAY
ncbi:hypothetical protein EV179_002914 [Coemansia sp. RSA 487]|nr:hypothetical protein EV179_002914 [Coemansia sp. RSA 487]